MAFCILQDEIEAQLDKQREIDEIYLGFDGNDDEFFRKRPQHQDVNEEDIEKNFLATKPWLGSLFPPSNYRKPVPNGTKGEYLPAFTEESNNWAEPEIDLTLDYAYGYRARDCRNNVFQIDGTNVLYPCAALAVIKDTVKNDETFFKGHTGDVLCLDYHGPTGLVCSGSSAANFEAQLCIWDYNNPSAVLHNIQGFHQYAVVSCCFNPQGTMVLSIGLDEHHSVALHCTMTGYLLACCQADKSRVVHGRFMQCAKSKSETTFVTVGTKHINFWGPIEESSTMTWFADTAPEEPAKSSVHPSERKPNVYMVSQNPVENRLATIRGSGCKELNSLCMLSIEFARTHVLIGASNGTIYAFHAATKVCEYTFPIVEDRIITMAYVGLQKYTPRTEHTTVAIGSGSGHVFFYKASYENVDGQTDKSFFFELDKSMTADKTGIINVNKFNEATGGAVVKKTNNTNALSPNVPKEVHKVYPASVRALNYSVVSKTLLIGTILNHIYRVDPLTTSEKTQPEVMVNGHWGDLEDPSGYGELWGVAASPNAQVIATACDDGLVRQWDLDQAKEIASKYIGEPAISVSWANNDEMIAVGFKNGGFAVYSKDLNTCLFRSPKPKKTIRVMDIQFSPNSEYLALGAEMFIEVYKCYAGTNPTTGSPCGAFTKVGICKGHASYITAFDWNIDSRLIQSTSNSYELLFFDVPTCERLVGEYLADQVWFTQTCTLGWSVQGIWPRFADGTDINCVAKSHSEQWIITGDDWSQVKMFNYPCVGSGTDRRTGQVKRKPDHKLFTGHASHVSGCVWTFDDTYVCTLGGRDMTILAWKVNYNGVAKREHILDVELIRQRELNQRNSNIGNDTSIHCYMCGFEYPDEIAKTCPVCFAQRVLSTKDHRRAWINLAESRHRLPTSAFANHARLQLQMRKEIASRPSLGFMSSSAVVTKPPENEASCSDSDNENQKNVQNSGTDGYERRKLVQPKSAPSQKKKPTSKKTSGPDFRDY